MTLRLPLLRVFLASLAGLTALIWMAGPSPLVLAAIVGGEALFAANFFLLLIVGARLFKAAAARGEDCGRTRRARWRGAALGGLLFVKTVLLAAGAFVALVWLPLPPLAFVGGCGGGLVALVAAALIEPRLRPRSGVPNGVI